MSPRRAGNPLEFGGRVPAAVGGLLVATAAVSLGAALAGQAGAPLGGLLLLLPAAVLEGAVWRLVTFVLLETNPVNLLLGGLVLWWLGTDLVAAWGPRRFLTVHFAVPAVAAALTTLLSLAWGGLSTEGFAGFWVALDALLVAWGLLHPYRQILLFMAVPVSGRTLAMITVGGTALFALFTGPAAFVPHLLAEGLAWGYVSGIGPGRWLERFRFRRRRARFEVIHADRDPDRRWLNRVAGVARSP